MSERAVIEAEMAEIQQRVLALLASADGWAGRDAVSSGVEKLMNAVHPYTEHVPESLLHADTVVVVDRSVPGAAMEAVHDAREWVADSGPELIGGLISGFARRGGRLRLSGSLMSGRAEVVMGIGTDRERYTGLAWYAADENGVAIEPF
jgi:hypothetical protein